MTGLKAKTVRPPPAELRPPACPSPPLEKSSEKVEKPKEEEEGEEDSSSLAFVVFKRDCIINVLLRERLTGIRRGGF